MGSAQEDRGAGGAHVLVLVDDTTGVAAVVEAATASAGGQPVRVISPSDDAWLGSLGPGVRTFVIASSDPLQRRRLAVAATQAGWRPLTVVHPEATVGGYNRIGPGSVVCAGVRITTDVTVGPHVLLESGVTLAHDNVVGEACVIGAGCNVAGNVTIGAGSRLGARSVVIPGVTIGADVVVDPDSVVTRDVAAGATVSGVPARTADDP